jgi:hypothetical protein
LPDAELTRKLDSVAGRARLRSLLLAAAAGGAAFAAVFVVLTFAGEAPRALRLLVPAAAAGAVLLWCLRGRWTMTQVTAAMLVEREAGALDNLIVTAAELPHRQAPVRADLRDEILRQAANRMAGVHPAAVVPMAQPAAVSAAVIAGCLALVLVSPEVRLVLPGSGMPVDLQAAAHGIDAVTVRVTPPPYARRPAETYDNPVQVSAIAGSRIRIDVASRAAGVHAEVAGQPARALAPAGDRFALEWQVDESIAIALRPDASATAAARFLSVIAVPDAAPTVRVVTPGRDMAVARPGGQIAITIESEDDLGLASLALRFTKASGGGESLTFTEGDVPLTVVRADERRWQGRASWVLDGLALSDGDVLVYRAVARDRNPRGAAVQSEQYLIEVGRRSEAVGAGFALPAEEKKYAISQQMVIYKTEQLLATKARHASDWLEQNQMLAIEQRMVRSEVIFLGGGEVQDEIEEAAHSHELAEGRLENAGRAEMLRAINFMSRAEAQLNDGRAAEALVFERQALRSLELAFDRRRYFLRTMPERSRIDQTRRLSGDVREARSWTRERSEAEAAAVLERQRAVMAELAGSLPAGAADDAGLAARVAALDPSSTALQAAAVGLASAATPAARREAAETAMQAISAHAMASLETPATLQIRIDPMAGHLADALGRAKGVRR